MALPEQVQKQSEAAKKYFADLADDGTGQAPGTPPVEPPKEPVQPTVPAAQVQPAAPAEPLPAGTSPADDIEQKYRTLQGMFNAEVPKLNATIREQADRLAQMENLMATLQKVPSPTQATAAQKLVTDADVQEYGDSIEMMRKVSKEELNPVYAKLGTLEVALNNLATSLNTSVLPQVRHVAQRQAVSADEQFWNTLQREVPDWQQTNNDQDFKSWLLAVDPLTGATRQSFLQQAQDALDANRVVAFFKSYAVATGKTIPATPNLAQPNGSASELELQLAPGRSRGGQPPVNPNVKTYSQADIAKFYSDVRKGVYKGREAERNQIELDILLAPKEGRIVANA